MNLAGIDELLNIMLSYRLDGEKGTIMATVETAKNNAIREMGEPPIQRDSWVYYVEHTDLGLPENPPMGDWEVPEPITSGDTGELLGIHCKYGEYDSEYYWESLGHINVAIKGNEFINMGEEFPW